MAKKAATVGFERILLALACVGLLGCGAYYGLAAIKDHRAQAAATVQARQAFPQVRERVVARLRQPGGIELGAVWATHGGRICGLVNARGSFGGLAGMMPFYADRGQVRYGLEGDTTAFDHAWLDCGADHWIEILPGSIQEGFCATRAGAKRCQ